MNNVAWWGITLLACIWLGAFVMFDAPDVWWRTPAFVTFIILDFGAFAGLFKALLEA